jgi:hypothetical protein
MQAAWQAGAGSGDSKSAAGAPSDAATSSSPGHRDGRPDAAEAALVDRTARQPPDIDEGSGDETR